jgi:phosphohistidine phosphatase
MTTTDTVGPGETGSERRLILMRHAKSDWSASGRDIDRPINSRGENDAPRMGAWLREQGLVPDWVACSPALRAQQTLAGVRTELPLDSARVVSYDALYMASLSDLLGYLPLITSESRLAMLIAHNPGMAHLLSYLVGEAGLPPVGNVMPTAAIACISLPKDWRSLPAGCGTLVNWMAPKRLPD